MPYRFTRTGLRAARTRWSLAAFAALVAALIAVAVGIWQSGNEQTSTEAPPLANLWIDADGGSCLRSADEVEYDTAAACATLDDAYDAANAARASSLVRLKGGAYGDQQITGDRKSLNRITFEATPGDAVEIGALTLGSFAFEQDESVGPDSITLRRLTLSEYGGSDAHAPLNRKPIFVSFGATRITIEQLRAGSLQTAGAKDLIVRTSIFGPCWAGSSMAGDEFTQTCGNFKLDGGWSGTPRERMAQRIVLEGNIFHDFLLGPSCFTTAQGGTHTGRPTAPDCHYECVFLNGGIDVAVRGNLFRGCALMNLFTEDTQGYGYTRLVVENNVFGTPVSYGTPGNFETSSFTRADAVWIGCKPTHPGYSDVVIRNNSFALNTGMSLEFSACGTADDISVSGNIAQASPCSPDVAFAYNVFRGQLPVCAPTDVHVGLGGGFYADETATPDLSSFALAGEISEPDDLVPIAYCPSTDIRGVPRSGERCDAGAYERGE